ncbi:MAG: hypothetical protein AAF725_09295 [Acidobacteriota bacterium]
MRPPSAAQSLPWIVLILLSAASAVAEFPSRSAEEPAADPGPSSGLESPSSPSPRPSSPGSGPAVSSASIARSAQPWIASGLASLSQDPRPLARIEIVADYEYYGGDGQREIRDITRIDFPSTLWQERHLEGGHVQRGIDPQRAFLKSPRGEIELADDQRRELTDYLCMRRLAFLSFCDDFKVDIAETTSDLIWLRVSRGDENFARLALDSRTALPSRLEWQPEDPLDEAGAIVTHFKAYQPVDGWLLPHEVESFTEGALFYRYRVASAEAAR